MNASVKQPIGSIQLCTIGTVHRNKTEITLEIAEAYRAGLRQLENFSHVIVLWWANHRDNPESRSFLEFYPAYAAERLTGVFATRSPQRPNPIGMTTCKLLGVDLQAGVARIVNIDAMEGTPILDLKAYFPVCDRVKDATIPTWLQGWPEWLPDEGLGLPEDKG